MPDAAVVETDLTCVKCGYNLRTMTFAGACPECRTPVARSRLPDAFVIRDRGPLRLLKCSLSLLMFASVFKAFGDPILFFCEDVVVRISPRHSFQWVTVIYGTIGLVPVVALTLAIIGVLRVARGSGIRPALPATAMVVVLLDGMGSVIFFLNSYIPSTSGSLTLALHRLSYIGRLGWPLLHAFLLFWFLHILNGTACRWGRRLLVVGIVMGVVQLLMDVLPWIWFRLDIDWGESTAWKRIYLYEFWAYLGLMGAAFVYLRLRLIRV